ncbi:Calcium/calmodulin-dependent protein kinase kinase 2 [Camponotus japonicus]
MKLLGYCLFCLLAARVQSKPQITKLFPVEGTYQKQLNNTTKPLDKFLEKLRATYNLFFRQTNNTNVEKILAKDTSVSDLQALKLIWADKIKTDRYANLEYPNNSFLDEIKTISTLKNYENKANSRNLEKESSVKIGTTIKANERNVNSMSDEKSSNKMETLPDDDWFNDVQPLEQLELQDEEINKKNEVEIVTARTTLQSPRVGHQLIEWFGSLFGLNNIYAKLSGASCGSERMQ